MHTKHSMLTMLGLLLTFSGCASINSSATHNAKGTQPTAAPITRHYINPWEKDLGYAQLVQVGNELYLSGIVSNQATMSEQIIEIYAAIKGILEKFDASLDNIVSEVIYTTDMEALIKAQQTRKDFFTDEQYPASSWVQIERLYLPEAMLEIEVRAVIN